MNLPIEVDDDTLKRARIRAIQENTSVNAVLRDYLTAYAGADRRRAEACERLLALSRDCTSGRGGATWTREELHERIDSLRIVNPFHLASRVREGILTRGPIRNTGRGGRPVSGAKPSARWKPRWAVISVASVMPGDVVSRHADNRDSEIEYRPYPIGVSRSASS